MGYSVHAEDSYCDDADIFTSRDCDTDCCKTSCTQDDRCNYIVSEFNTVNNYWHCVHFPTCQTHHDYADGDVGAIYVKDEISDVEHVYGLTIDGDGCNSGRITDEQECIEATKALGGTYGNSWWGKSDAPGCIFANDGRNKVYFNMELNANGRNSRFQEICKMSTCSTPIKGICEDHHDPYGPNKESIPIWGIWDSFTEDDCFKECAKFAATDGEGCCHYGPESHYSMTSNPICKYIIGDRILPGYSSYYTDVLRVSECGASSNLAMGSEVLKAANTNMMRQIEQAVGGSTNAKEANQVIGTTANAVLVFAAIGAMATIYYGLKGAHKVLFTTNEFQKIEEEC